MLNPSSPLLPSLDSAALSVRDPAHIWRYLRTQWRRVFGVNVTQIDELLFVGGQFRPQQWPALHALGIRAVLSLQAEYKDQFHGPAPARTLRLEVLDFHPPTVEQLHEAVAFIESARAEGLPVMVHCHAGIGRAALTASAYLVSQGLDHAAAFRIIRRARPIVVLNAMQQARLAEWEGVLRAGQI
jgi:protein tyrosine/serine phosphatase